VRGEGCGLRPLVPADVPLVVQAGEGDIPDWTFFPRHPTPAEARAWLDRDLAAAAAGTRVRFVVEVDGVPAGMVGGEHPHTADPGVVEAFYFVYPSYRRRGLATRALQAFDRWVVGAVPGLRRLQLHVVVGNPGSQRVAEAAGYAEEGIAVALIPAVNGFPVRDAHVHARRVVPGA